MSAASDVDVVPHVPVAALRRRAVTTSIKRLAKRELFAGQAACNETLPPLGTYTECKETKRGSAENPCAHVRCKWSLAVDVSERSGAIRVFENRGVDEHGVPVVDPHAMVATCALYEAERGGLTLEEAGDAMNLTRERVRQIETRALAKIRRAAPDLALLLADEPLGSDLGSVHTRPAARVTRAVPVEYAGTGLINLTNAEVDRAILRLGSAGPATYARAIRSAALAGESGVPGFRGDPKRTAILCALIRRDPRRYSRSRVLSIVANLMGQPIFTGRPLPDSDTTEEP